MPLKPLAGEVDDDRDRIIVSVREPLRHFSRATHSKMLAELRRQRGRT